MNTKIKTLTVKLSDAEIGRNAKLEHVRDLRDAGHPALHFRFSKNRTRGAWYLVNKRRWHRIGAFPDLSSKQVLAALPAVRLRVSADAGATISQWATTGELLSWYAGRMALDRNLSAKRKTTGASAMKCHLLPRLSGLPLAEVNKAALDHLFMWPLQETLSIDYVRLAFQLLASAFRQALTLGLLSSNPMAGIKFSDFSKAKVGIKPSRLRGVQLQDLLGEAQQKMDQAKAAGAPITQTYRRYLASDLSAPAEPPIRMKAFGAGIEGTTVQITAGYGDLINRAFPRDKLTTLNAPCMKYL